MIRSKSDLLAVLRDVMEAIEEHEAYRDETSAEKLFKRVPWIREILIDESESQSDSPPPKSATPLSALPTYP
jgi:hypothetical protein